MSRFGEINRISRGFSRPNNFYDIKQTVTYNPSIRKPNSQYYDGSIGKSTKNNPVTSANGFKNSILDSNNYKPYSYISHVEKLQENKKYDQRVDPDHRGEREYRIRVQTKEKTLGNSRKNEKEDEEKAYKDISRLVDQSKIEKERSEQNIQKLKEQPSREYIKKESSEMGQCTSSQNGVEKKLLTSMTNSTTTGTSDQSSSSLRQGYRNGNSGSVGYGFSTTKSSTIGLVGLNNIGNTCFMNSILQCVFNLPGFNEYFLNGDYSSEFKSTGRVAEAYAKTIKIMRNSTSRSETPSELKSAIGAKKSRFQGYSQQDAQEFLAALLELLSIDLNRSKNPKYKELTADLTKQSLKEISDDWWNYNKQREDSIVCDFFSGQILSRVVCSRCGHESIAFDNIWDMALNFSGNDGGDLMKMIDNFLKEETISNDYYCSKCKTFRECTRKIDFFRLPKILVFQLKRFSYGKYRKSKLNNQVIVETTLDLTPVLSYSDHPSARNPVYNLVGVVNHSGDIDFGHYTADCKNPINGRWYDFNDSSVHEISRKDDFRSSSPYLLFYAKKDIC